MRSQQNWELWRGLQGLKELGDAVKKVAKEGIEWRVGSGDKIKFWSDVWFGESCLATRYPRLYQVSIQQKHTLNQMGFWEGTRWRWSLCWRRSLFQWEETQLRSLKEELQEQALKGGNEGGNEDVVRWKYHSEGKYSVKSFTDAVWKEACKDKEDAIDYIGKWRRLAPYRVEVLTWLILLGKLNTKDKLLRLKLIPQEESLCVLCKEKEESIHHLFAKCSYAGRLWEEAKAWWDIAFPLPGDVVSIFNMWVGVWKAKTARQAWVTLFFVIMDSIWSARNKVLFQGIKINMEKEY